MDGGRILRAALAFRLDRDRATALAARIGQAIAVFMGIAGLAEPSEMTDMALRRLESGRVPILVVEKERLIGLVAAENISEVVALRRALTTPL